MPSKNFPAPRLRIASVLSLLALVACSDKQNDATTVAPAQSEAVQQQFEVIRTLIDFDSGSMPEGLETDSAVVSLAPAADFGTGSALKVKFLADDYRPTVRFRPQQPWDLSAESDFHIAFDAKNIGSESVQLYLSITDAEGGKQGIKVTGNRNLTANRSANIAAGESGTYFAVLNGPSLQADSGLRQSPPPWESGDEMMYWRYGNKGINLAAITEISLFVRGTLAEKQVLVDNIRVRRNPPYNEHYLQAFVDRFGQNAKQDFPIKVHSEAELKQAADAELAALAASGPMADRSRFGGWKDGPRLEGSGYFRTAKVDGKWWLVDPDGYLFFSHGVANVRMANLTTLTGVDFRDPSIREVDPGEVTPEDSIGIVQVPAEVRESHYVASAMRHNMFTWLPEYDDELADHYSYRRSVLHGPLKSGETFSFYRANLERRYGETAPQSYVRKWEEVTLARMLDWGFTSMGNWVDPAFYPNQKVPYFANGWIIGDYQTLSSPFDVWAPMPDPFDPEFVRRAKITIDVIAEEIKGTPWCVGVFIDNEKSWGHPDGSVEQRYGVIVDALSKSAAESPAKRAFSDYLRQQYGTIARLNERWETQLASWDELAAGVTLAEYTAAAEADLSSLLELLSEEYFRVVHDTLEQALPNHLYMGARMANWGMPPETIKASVKYSDVLSFNIYEEGIQPHAWSFLNEIDLPTVIGEFHIGASRETGLYHPGLVQADGQADRAAMYKAYMESVIAHDNMVGAHWFQYVDSPITGRAFDGENYNVGFVSATDIPYPEMVKAAREFNAALYAKRYGL
ncbi:MAG: agarase [Gammaproteobacteria bacterium]|uniref:agarase n=1 Tax=Pseudomaricurvus alcaniphilus TaxID=1166482 RepID=UPI00140C45BF|nr:agarase [Pseudomaricurvus alcaniphilus]MBR9913024.1 agarase [Gammaproteobacteria bacterium]NHN38387.1 agarase [Pseudomaricurvus alcaniphilus]